MFNRWLRIFWTKGSRSEILQGVNDRLNKRIIKFVATRDTQAGRSLAQIAECPYSGVDECGNGPWISSCIKPGCRWLCQSYTSAEGFERGLRIRGTRVSNGTRKWVENNELFYERCNISEFYSRLSINIINSDLNLMQRESHPSN